MTVRRCRAFLCRRHVAALLGVVGVVGCARSSPATDDATNGERIPLDTAELNTARRDRHLSDSLGQDKSLKAGDREFVSIARETELLSAQETLARLGYGIAMSGDLDTPTRNAVRSFEKRHGLPETGSPFSPEFKVALNYVERRTFSLFGLPELTVSVSTWNDSHNGAAHAKGTWVPADPPRQTSNIWCYRGLRLCRETVAYLLGGELYTDVIEYEVEHWDDDELVARSTNVCVSDVLTFNRARESLSLVRSPRNQTNELCKLTRTKSDDVVARLTDGHSVRDSLNFEAMKYEVLGRTAAAWLQRVRAMGKKP